MGNDSGVMKLVMQHVFWCFPQCMKAFKHCRLTISVDVTFLMEKYKGTLMIAADMMQRISCPPSIYVDRGREEHQLVMVLILGSLLCNWTNTPSLYDIGSVSLIQVEIKWRVTLLFCTSGACIILLQTFREEEQGGN